MTSATLSAGDGNLGYFRQRVGAEEVRSLQIGSPFDYERQMKLYVVKSMPEPADSRYGEELVRWVAHFLDESDGRAFVLFTSYRQMMAAVDALEAFIDERGWTLLVQGKGSQGTSCWTSFVRICRACCLEPTVSGRASTSRARHFRT